MNEEKWESAYIFMMFYVFMLGILTAIVAAFWVRDHVPYVFWQSLVGVSLIMLLALFFTGWALSD